MRDISLNEALDLHVRVIAQSGGATGVRDLGALEAALAQPRLTFGGQDLYPTLIEKAAAIGFSVIQGHPFVDGNKRVGHALMEVFLVLNGWRIDAPIDEEEAVILQVASGTRDRERFVEWLRQHTVPLDDA